MISRKCEFPLISSESQAQVVMWGAVDVHGVLWCGLEGVPPLSVALSHAMVLGSLT